MTTAAIQTKLSQPLRVRLDVKVPMRDGVKLSADIYTPNGSGPWPVLLDRTIYDNQNDRGFAWIARFVEAGYAVVMQDCRGRYDSDGTFQPYINEAADGHDTVEWIGKQPWCNGKVGMFGISYIGFTQTQAALGGSQYLQGIMPIAAQQDNFGHWYADGIFQLHVGMNFIRMAGRTMQSNSRNLMNSEELYNRLPLVSALDDIVDLPFFKDAVKHSEYGEFWQKYSMRDKYDRVDAPAYFVTGWYDNLLRETFRLFQGWTQKAKTEKARKATKLVVGPWAHHNIGSAEQFGVVGFGTNAGMDIAGEHIRWYDCRLKGIDNGIDSEAPMRIFTMGENRWRTENQWPLPNMKYHKFFLHGRKANSLYGEGTMSLDKCTEDEEDDTFIYDPRNPVPTVGGQSLGVAGIVPGPADRRPVQRRDDVLVYTTAPLEKDMEATGPALVTLWASSEAKDTDFTANVTDVYPDGTAVAVCEGISSGRWAELKGNPIDQFKPEFMKPGEITKFSIQLWEMSYVFKKGHRIRLELSSSNFPRYARNLNTGAPFGTDSEMVVAKNTVYHRGRVCTHLTLPIIPRE